MNICKVVNSSLASVLLIGMSAQALTPSVGEIKDSRTTGQFFAELEVEVKFIGDELVQYKAVRPAIEKAVDDTGRDILDADKKSSEFEELGRFGQQSNSIRLKFKNPARKAAMISQLKGKFEFYNPTLDPNALIKIENFLTKSGKPIQHPGLTSTGITLTVLSKEDYAKKAAADQKKAQDEARKQGMPEEVIKSMGALMGGFSEVGENSIVYEIKDPGQKLISYRVLDRSGKEIDRQSTMTTSDTRTVDYSQKVPNDATLELQLLTDKAVAMVPVDLTNIALP